MTKVFTQDTSRVCEEWDALVNELLDLEPEAVTHTFTTYFPKQDLTIWTSNYPYSYGSLVSRSFYQRGLDTQKPLPNLPKMTTRKRLKEYCDKFAATELSEEMKEVAQKIEASK